MGGSRALYAVLAMMLTLLLAPVNGYRFVTESASRSCCMLPERLTAKLQTVDRGPLTRLLILMRQSTYHARYSVYYLLNGNNVHRRKIHVVLRGIGISRPSWYRWIA